MPNLKINPSGTAYDQASHEPFNPRDSVLEMPGIALVEEDEEYACRMRPIVLWREDERWHYDCGRGAWIEYRRILSRIRDDLLADAGFSERSPQAVDRVLRYCITGWGGFKRKDRETPFHPDLIVRLPEDIRYDIVQKVFLPCPDINLFGSEPWSLLRFRRQTSVENQVLLDNNTERGVIDQAGFTMDLMKLCIRGWERVLNWRGEPVAFDAALVPCLPDASRTEFAPHLRTVEVVSEEDLLKNLKAGGSASNSTLSMDAGSVA